MSKKEKDDKKIYLCGNKYRGDAIIKTLGDKGTSNVSKYDRTDEDYVYYINFDLIPDFNENTQMYRDFLKYKGYKDNWDEEGSNAMTKEVASNFTKVYYFLSKEAKESLVLSLDYNGTLLLETANRNAGIEIGNKAYTFHMFDGNTLNGEEHVPFNAYKVASLANKFIEMNL